MNRLLVIALGAGVGALARYLVSGWAQRMFGSSFPWGTAIVNIVGCFLIGFLMTWSIERSPMSLELRLLLVTGFLGSLTTFSTFGYETMRFSQDGVHLMALANVALNVIAGFAAVVFGTWIARNL